jgi:hypothetical protein
MSAFEMYVGFSTDGATFTEVSGAANSVEISGGERVTGSQPTFTGDTMILKKGKRGTITVTVRGVYTPDADEVYALAKTSYESGGTFYVRWSPGGGDAGDVGYTTSAGIIKNPPYPGGSADSGDPILTEVQVECASVTVATIGTSPW